MNKVFVLIFFFALVFAFVPRVSAAIIFPECGWNEITFSCQCPHADNACADNTCDACLVYKNDPGYRYLWKDIYCRKGSLLELASKYRYSFIIPFLTAVLIDLAVYVVRGYRKMHILLTVLLVNCVSFFGGILFLRLYSSFYKMLPVHIPNIPFSLYGMDVPRLVSLLITAIVITVFEIAILIHTPAFRNDRRVVATAILANIISLVLGLGTLNAVYPHYLQPRLF